MLTSASAGYDRKGDALVEIQGTRTNGNVVIIESPIREMFGIHQDRAVGGVLEELEQTGLIIHIKDNHALDFVLRARVRAAVERFLSPGESQ
jgi:citrate lyase subunit gamma (acyl carrier protein)